MKKILVVIIGFLICVFSINSIQLNALSSRYNSSKLSVELQNSVREDTKKLDTYTILVKLVEFDEYSDSIHSLITEYEEKMTRDNIEINNMLLMEYRIELQSLNTIFISKQFDHAKNKYSFVEYSLYTPFITIETDIDGVCDLSFEENVESIYEIVKPSNLSNYQKGKSSEEYEYNFDSVIFDDDLNYNIITGVDTVKDQWNVDGTGVNIGIIEALGYPDVNNPEFDNFQITFAENATNYYEYDHATTVSIILAGRESGIANKSDVFFIGDMSTYSFVSLFESLAAVNVNVINCSWGDNTTDPGVYDSQTAWLDYFIRTTRVSVVKSSGNRGEDDALITSPGLAGNAIIVGSTTFNGSQMSSFSSYATDDETLNVTIVAPGGDADAIENSAHSLGVPNAPTSIWNYESYKYIVIGTSFAAPQVTGAIALMFEERPGLLFFPQEVSALLTSGASYDSIANIDIDTPSGLSKQAGAGLMNLVKTFESIEKLNSFGYATNSTIPGLMKSVNVYFVVADEITISNFFFRNQTSTSSYEMSDFDVIITHQYSSTVVWSTSSSDSNLEIMKFIVPYSGVYTIKIYLREHNSYNAHTLYGIIGIYSADGRRVLILPAC